MNFFKCLQTLRLNQHQAAELFSVQVERFRNWYWQNKAVPTVSEHIDRLTRALDQQVDLWLQQIQKHHQQEGLLALPVYGNYFDFHASDPDFAEALCYFLPLYHSFTQKLIAALFNLGIKAKTVVIDFDDYSTWLTENDFENCISARIMFAGLKLNKKIK